jgi:hypothetical protein
MGDSESGQAGGQTGRKEAAKIIVTDEAKDAKQFLAHPANARFSAFQGPVS